MKYRRAYIHNVVTGNDQYSVNAENIDCPKRLNDPQLANRGRLRDDVCACVCFELWIRYDFSWFEATLECGRVPVSESCGLLMIGNHHNKDLISLLEIRKDTSESQ